eukprot:Gregarina_sp_Poly_1__1562@NODE_1397_length_4220_cov_187_503491_g930_i0_p4_GENE_NODE_1397_length_4220_cov_187_503491_g930_i0NODE_1397_length_4220_cov_187_503491_g930_i0_p4_ORF_typecomplete_len173_score30_66BMP2K_C/PF15282_6/0_0064YqeY/PF09424_10/0_016Raptor_N/PF14538_6/0_65_NODE_1397_length_4220_cov_187_503491_g930_i019542472
MGVTECGPAETLERLTSVQKREPCAAAECWRPSVENFEMDDLFEAYASSSNSDDESRDPAVPQKETNDTRKTQGEDSQLLAAALQNRSFAQSPAATAEQVQALLKDIQKNRRQILELIINEGRSQAAAGSVSLRETAPHTLLHRLGDTLRSAPYEMTSTTYKDLRSMHHPRQ